MKGEGKDRFGGFQNHLPPVVPGNYCGHTWSPPQLAMLMAAYSISGHEIRQRHLPALSTSSGSRSLSSVRLQCGRPLSLSLNCGPCHASSRRGDDMGCQADGGCSGTWIGIRTKVQAPRDSWSHINGHTIPWVRFSVLVCVFAVRSISQGPFFTQVSSTVGTSSHLIFLKFWNVYIIYISLRYTFFESRPFDLLILRSKCSALSTHLAVYRLLTASLC